MLDMKKLLGKMITRLYDYTYDSGWKTLSTTSSAGAIYYRKVGKAVEIEGQALTATHSTSLGTLPAGYRPSQRVTIRNTFPIALDAYVNIPEAGTITPYMVGQTSSVNLYFHGMYFI